MEIGASLLELRPPRTDGIRTRMVQS